MLHKTRGIVLNSIKYKESSIIVKVFTEEFGLQSYIVNSVRSKSSKKNKIALFQPLTLLELVVYYTASKSINRISEQKCSFPFSSIPFKILKSSLVLFIGEILIKVLSREEEANPPLFEFIDATVRRLDQENENLQNFHIHFLINLLSYIGLKPLDSNNMFDSIKLSYQGNNRVILPTNNEFIFIDECLVGGNTKNINSIERRNIIQFIINYYSSQIENFGTVKSKDILQEVLS